jgi:hypothetical protein
MTSLITTLLLATQLNVAEAKKRAVPHKHHAPKRHHVHVTHKHHHYNVAKPHRPPKARTAHSVYFYRGHWVMVHHKPHLMWKWNHLRSKWVIVIRF